jgi:hypothetical protein
LENKSCRTSYNKNYPFNSFTLNIRFLTNNKRLNIEIGKKVISKSCPKMNIIIVDYLYDENIEQDININRLEE